jgi:cell division septation protein DedD
MERQTRHRLLGMIVVIALVIILLPLFQSNKNITTETTLIATPPFPDQPAEVTSTLPPAAPLNSAEAAQPEMQLSQDDIIQPKLAMKEVALPEKTPIADVVQPIKPSKYRIIEADSGAYKKSALAMIHKSSPKLIKASGGDEGIQKLKSALNIVNQLRANGYRAFMQQITTTFEDTTRVYVGPEHKQASARELATRLQTDMHLKGMVVSYKPLTL